MKDEIYPILGVVLLFMFIGLIYYGGIRDGRKQGVEQGKQIIHQEAVEKGLAKWFVDQKTGESKIVWCEGMLITEKEKNE